MPLDTVNPHYLSHLQASSEALQLRAGQDIYAANGTKLLARGSRIDERVGEQLTKHKLRQPLENQLEIDAGEQRPQLCADVQQLLHQDTLLTQCLSGHARELLQLLGTLQLPALAEQSLTLLRVRFPGLYQHLLRVMMLAWHLAPAERYTGALLQAALFHDVGYLYLDAQVWQKTIPLSPSAWRQFDSHPLVGYVWASELKVFGGAVPPLILGHHERVDGSGYPRQVSGEQHSEAAEVLAMAEMMAGMLENTAQPVGQLQTALRLLPWQFRTGIRQRVLQLVDRLPREQALLSQGEPLESALHQLLLRMGRGRDILLQLDASVRSEAGRQLCAQLTVQMGQLERAFNSVGLEMLTRSGVQLSAADSRGLWQELGWVIAETNWMTRHLARGLVRQQIRLPAEEVELFEPMVVLFLGLSDDLTRAGL